ncbi:MAG TPA: MBL fold metallo-hydrolase [Pyrinomonadaceae bacterium]
MNDNKLYLKQNVVIEPLINQWYAWSSLLSPATAAMFITNLHLKIMQSFVNSPQVHVTALKNPAMLGGPFINYAASRSGEVRALMEKTVKEQAHMLELAGAIKTLHEMLISDADGCSLEAMYRRIPELLKGYVELVYDLNNYPSVRFIEGLLYKSRYYNESSQSIGLSLSYKDDRPFALSSPKLEDDSWLNLKIPFRSEVIDELAKMKSVPQSVEYIREALGLGEQNGLFSSLFTETPPPVRAPYTDDGVRIRYFGHACLLVETKRLSILSDPVLSYLYPTDFYRYTYADLPERIDYVLLTHNHQDHCMFETLLQLRHRIKTVIVPKNNGGSLADVSMKMALQQLGFHNVQEIDEMEEIEVADGTITGLPFLGEHADLNIRSKTAFLIELYGKTMLCAADSNNIEPELYEHLHEAIGDIDILFLGMECEGAPLSWLYGPLLTKPVTRKMDQSRRFSGSDCERGLGIVEKLKPKHVYVYAMGQEPWLTYLTSIQYTDTSRPIVESNKLVEHCRNLSLVSDRLYGHKELFL